LIFLQELIDRTGYKVDVTVGQRRYGGPPPGWEGPADQKPPHEVSFLQTFYEISKKIVFSVLRWTSTKGRV
jgi:hypothetical protein